MKPTSQTRADVSAQNADGFRVVVLNRTGAVQGRCTLGEFLRDNDAGELVVDAADILCHIKGCGYWKYDGGAGGVFTLRPDNEAITLQDAISRAASIAVFSDAIIRLHELTGVAGSPGEFFPAVTARNWPEMSQQWRYEELMEYVENTARQAKASAAAHSLTNLDARELASVLAGLRLLQRLPSEAHLVEEVSTNLGAFERLNDSEIDALCQRLRGGAS